MKFFRILLIISILFISYIGFAQEPNVTAELDTNSVQIGDQFLLMLKVDQDQNDFVKFPTLDQDSLYKKLEVLEVFPADSVQLPDNRVHVQQNMKVTIWEKGQYDLPPLKFIRVTGQKTDTLTARELLLTVGAPQIDTTQAIKDIAPVYETPMTFSEFLQRYWLIIAVALLVVILTIALIFYLKNKEKQPKTVLKRPNVPPHEIAIKALDELKEKQLWETGKFKAYFSEMTDILKHYIDARYQVSVMELTSHETMVLLKRVPQSDAEANQILEKVFELADLAKFAKYTPLADENEQSLKNAYLFVGLSREKPQPKEPEKVEAQE